MPEGDLFDETGEYIDRITFLQRKLAEARADTERLDWLDSQAPPVLLRIARKCRDDDEREEVDIRATIDDARAAEHIAHQSLLGDGGNDA